MEGLFLQILNISVSASWLILAVIGIRFLMQKGNAPKNLRYLLWLFVAIRLLCPFTIESAMSLLPRQEVLPNELQVSNEEQVDKLIDVKVEEEIVHEHINGIENIILNSNDEDVDANKNMDANNADTNPEYEINWVSVISVIWGISTIGFLGYGIASYMQLNKKVSASVCKERHVWIICGNH